jgi:hypothetical protein
MNEAQATLLRRTKRVTRFGFGLAQTAEREEEMGDEEDEEEEGGSQ